MLKAAIFATALCLPTPSFGKARAQGISLELPVACQLGKTCEIQNYVDRDPAPDRAIDYRGGSLTYDAHNGTDIRIPTLAAQRRGVEVLAAAAGRVLRLRDGMDDRSVREPGRQEAVANAECGNGVVVGHPGGWETQYCHMAKGSVRATVGQSVKAGQPIGLIGLSGETEYPHLHFTVRHGTGVIDPFAIEKGGPLWRSVPAYKEGSILNVGFADQAVTMEFIEAGAEVDPNSNTAVLVVFGRAIGLRAGDQQHLTLTGPDGALLAENKAKPLPRNQAQSMIFAGRKRPPEGWSRGRYTGSYEVYRNGAVVLKRLFRLALD